MRNIRNHELSTPKILAGAFLTVFVLLWLGSKINGKKDEQHKPPEGEWSPSAHYRNKPPSAYWLTNGSAGALFDGRLSDMSRAIDGALLASKDADLRALEVYSKCRGRIDVGPLGGLRRFEGDVSLENDAKGRFEVVITDQSQSAAYPYAASYEHRGRKVVLSGIDWPSPLFEGIVVKELWLALQDGDSNRHSSDDQNRLTYEGMELEGAVINFLSKGQYFAHIDRMIDRASPPRDARVQASEITEADLCRLDSIIGAECSAADIGKLALVLHYYAVGIRWSKQTCPSDGWRLSYAKFVYDL